MNFRPAAIDEFVRGGFRAVTRARNNLEKEILESGGYLLGDLYAIVLEYSYISDSCIDPGAFTGREFAGYGTDVKDIEIVTPVGLDKFTLVCSIKMGTTCDVDDATIPIARWQKYECPIMFLLDMLVSQDVYQTVMKYIKNSCDNGMLDPFSLVNQPGLFIVFDTIIWI